MGGNEQTKKIGVWNWVATIILTNIPLVAIIPIFCYLCSKNKSKRTYALALIVCWIILAALVGATILILYFAARDRYDLFVDYFRQIMEKLGVNI